MKKILALILAFSMLFCFAACGGNTGDETNTTTAAETEADVIDTTAAVESTAANGEAASTEAVSAADESTTVAESTVPAITAAPTETADIIALYNDTINKAYNAKVGFNKERYTDNETLNAGFLLKTFGDLIYKFMGIGAENKYTKDVVKGAWEGESYDDYHLRKSTLSAADVTSAKCTEANGKYTIALGVKGGNSKASKDIKENNSPIDKCGICVGNADRSRYDHKTAPVIYSAIGEVLSSAIIEESYSNAKIVAVIDAATGNLVSLTVEFDINVVIEAAGGGNATGTTHIFYKNFKY